MKVLGISCSPRSGQTTDQLVKAVLDAVDGAETEFLSLAGKYREFIGDATRLDGQWE